MKGIYLSTDMKEELIRTIADITRTYRVTAEFCCMVLELSHDRYKRWIHLLKKEGHMKKGKPGPKKAPHALLDNETAKMQELLRNEEYADLSHRQLSIVASEKGIVEASPSSFYREMKAMGIESCKKGNFHIQEKPEVKPEKPNEAWSWDLTYIRLGPFFVYLFAIIDIYSRKIVSWHLSLNATVQEMKKAWDKALCQEGLVQVSKRPEMPLALSDHGVQMAKKSAKQFFKDLGIKQLFARYQTPKDNAWIESWFRTLKYDWLQFKDYITFEQLKQFIDAFVEYYNTGRYHSSLGYVTPAQMHTGKAVIILKKRRQRKAEARENRLDKNRESFTSETLKRVA